jgi:hypothetical protein
MPPPVADGAADGVLATAAEAFVVTSRAGLTDRPGTPDD